MSEKKRIKRLILEIVEQTDSLELLISAYSYILGMLSIKKR